MAEAIARIPVRTVNENVSIFDAPSRLTEAFEAPLMEALAQTNNGRTRAIVLNLSGLEHLNASGLGLLMILATRAGRQGQRVLAYGVSPRYRQVFALVHLDRALAVYSTEGDALAAAKSGAVAPPASEGVSSALHAPADAYWAQPVSRLTVTGLPRSVPNLNVQGREAIGPLDGFGPLLRKTYSIRLSGAPTTPAEVVGVWRREFASFWPKGNNFYGPHDVITPGDVAALNLTLLGPLKLLTGVLVIYADETSFSFMTPQGHMFGGLITFSAHDDRGTTFVQVQPLIRASDPFYDLTLRLGIGGAIEDRFWRQSLQNLASRFAVRETAQQTSEVFDRGVQWSKAGNIWHNAAIRTTLYTLAAPLRWGMRLLARS